MKISTFASFLVIIGLVMFILALYINEGASHYDIDVNNSMWQDKYNYSSEVGNNVQTIQDSFEDIRNEKTGWLSIGASGFTGIIAAVTLVPSLVISSISLTAQLITGFGSTVGLPLYIIGVIGILVTIWAMIKLIETYQRWNI